jgi:hypothetical protein
MEGAMKLPTRISWSLACAIILVCSSVPAWSGVHLWRIEEVYSNADGTIQFIEMTTCCMSSGGETGIMNQRLSSNLNFITFPANLPSGTNHHLLMATDGYAALPGVPPRDFRIVDNFFSPAGDRISFAVYDSWTFGAIVPTDGIDSLNKNPDDTTDTPFTRRNSPTNLREQTGTIGGAGGPPAVPDGLGGTTPLMVTAPTPDALNLRLSYDVASCATGAANHHIIYGQKSGLPSAPGGIYTPLGGVCNIGNTVPYDWIGTPPPDDGLRLLWFLVVTTDSAGVEGSWGKDSLGNERSGPGNGGSSGICALTRSLTNGCGHP